MLFQFLLLSLQNCNLIWSMLYKCLMLLLIAVKIIFRKRNFRITRILSYLSNLSFVAWVKGVIADAYWLKSEFWYSCIDDGGDCSFDIAQESKKFAFDAHKFNNLPNLSFCSSFAPKKAKRIKMQQMFRDVS